MTDAESVFDDLKAEGDDVDRLIAELPAGSWSTPTPAPGWTIAHQIAHLAWTDDKSLLAITDAEGFAADLAEAAARIATFVDDGAAEGASQPPAELLARWRDGRAAVLGALRAVPPKSRIPWYGPPMSAASMATARLMETWAHGLDVAGALGVKREPVARLRHIARLAARTRDFSYVVRGETPPTEEFRVELTGPDGDLWVFGPEDAAQRVTGPAVDLCLLAAQRVHRSDTALVAEGPDADHWLDIAQMFAGPPGDGRAPGGPA
ncbi:MAG: TIGR03084 family protein [Micromonosporaceae bacterium]|nr:TIGR03084 family protein [Micromonosporaceae bacterium]